MQIAYAESGQGMPLVLLHAYPLHAAMWAGQRDRLAADCRVITPDQRGFGDSDGSPDSDDPDLGHVADDVRDLLDRLDLPQVVLGGLSMGGYVALAFLRRYPERLAGLLLADTKATADTSEAAADRHRIADAVEKAGNTDLVATGTVPNLLGATTRWQRPEVYETVAELTRSQSPRAVAWAQRAMAVRADATDLLAEVSVPTLVVVGEEDTVTPPSDAVAIVDRVPGAQLRRIPAAGHLSALEAPDRFNTAVRSLLKRCAAVAG
ncbi:MAG: alpha/beta fold hydrolase [Actinocatenispora sp.]